MSSRIFGMATWIRYQRALKTSSQLPYENTGRRIQISWILKIISMRKIGKTYGGFLLPVAHAGNGIRNTVSHLQSNSRHLTALTRYPNDNLWVRHGRDACEEPVNINQIPYIAFTCRTHEFGNLTKGSAMPGIPNLRVSPKLFNDLKLGGDRFRNVWDGTEYHLWKSVKGILTRWNSNIRIFDIES